MDVGTFLSNGRFGRLCLKELRESLRDRRTVMTLILMPILVYPLLGMVLQRLLLGTHTREVTGAYVIGVEDPEDGSKVDELLFEAQQIVNAGGLSPIRPIEWGSPRTKPQTSGVDPLSQGNHQERNEAGAAQQEEQNREPPDRFRLVAVEKGTLAESLDYGTIDLAIAKIERKETRIRGNQSLEFDVEIHFRQGDGRSEDAAILLRKMCQLVNDQQFMYLLRSLDSRLQPAIQLKTLGIGRPSDPASSIATVIPLVLILMTITGAVYPAIDLTAGERERGTMEAMIATPAPRFALLLSKYVAVVTVSILTALANLFATWITLSFGGLGQAIFGQGGFTVLTLLKILPILAAFAAFFSSILLALCSFAKSFKEAQAYLIPVMLVSLAPGLVTLMPQIEFNSLLAVVPLLNVLLLSRDIMTGAPPLVPAVIALITTLAYGGAALVIASHLFGSANATMASQATWGDLIRTPDKKRDWPEIGTFALYLAILFPLLFVVSSLSGSLAGKPSLAMGLNALALLILFLVLPTIWLASRRVRLRSTYLLRAPGVSPGEGFVTPGETPGPRDASSPWQHSLRWGGVTFGIACLASTLWIFALEGVLLFKSWSLASFVPELEKIKEDWLKIPFGWILLTQALVPAIAEEFFFRGFALSALRTRLRSITAVLLSAFLFALFHIVAGNVLSLERFIPTLLLGLVLGFVAVSTGSIWPGVLLHALHNSLVLSFSRIDKERLVHWFGEGEHMPLWMLGIAGVVLAIGIWSIYITRVPRYAQNHR